MILCIKILLETKFLREVLNSLSILGKLNNKRIALEFQKVGAL